jgi:hypothetical protein
MNRLHSRNWRQKINDPLCSEPWWRVAVLSGVWFMLVILVWILA